MIDREGMNYMSNKTIIENRTYDEERALYHLEDALVRSCVFAGPADGESALKESRNVETEDCSFSLRYPLWHAKGFTMRRCTLDEGTRAPIWYASDGRIEDCTISGVKCLRECDRVTVEGSRVVSPEFGWKCRGLTLQNTVVTSEYFLFDSRDVACEGLELHGKYSFQYMENVRIAHSNLDTKDAFWHSKNVTVEDSIVRGEYLGWFSEGLTLVRCHIIGTQPLCYCRNLKLIDCTMEGADFAFEYSDVDATVTGRIDSVRNPRSGRIVADEIGAYDLDRAVMECGAEIVVREK